MRYREQRELLIRLSFTAEFGDDYEGEDDGYEWYRTFDERLRPEMLGEIVRILTRGGKFKVTPLSRGASSHDELEIRVERRET